MQPTPAKASAARVRLLRREVAAVWVSSCAARKVKLPAARPEIRGLGLGLGLGVGLTQTLLALSPSLNLPLPLTRSLALTLTLT